MGVWGIIFGGRGRHFGAILEVWAGSGSQMRVGRRSGRLLGDFKGQDGSKLKPKMVPSWNQNGIKIDAKIANLFDAFENRFLVEFCWILRGKWNQVGTKIGSKIDFGVTAEKSTKR